MEHMEWLGRSLVKETLELISFIIVTDQLASECIQIPI